MNSLKSIALIAAAGMLVGCSHATLDRDECLRGDWYQVGLQDGLNGKTQGELNLHKTACAEYGINPDVQKYSEGRDKGLADYCKLENAVTTGLNGQLYQGVCPKDVDEAFRRQNAAAYNLYLSTMRNSYYNHYWGWGGWGYPGYWGGYWNYPYGGRYYGGGRRGFGFRPFGGFRFGIRGGW
jgi:hypothetical protein